MKPISEESVVDVIRREVAKHASLREAARQWKVSPTYLCFVMSGKTRPGVSILKAIGWERAPATYRRTDK
jgi:hypothetical protein